MRSMRLCVKRLCTVRARRCHGLAETNQARIANGAPLAYEPGRAASPAKSNRSPAVPTRRSSAPPAHWSNTAATKHRGRASGRRARVARRCRSVPDPRLDGCVGDAKSRAVRHLREDDVSKPMTAALVCDWHMTPKFRGREIVKHECDAPADDVYCGSGRAFVRHIGHVESDPIFADLVCLREGSVLRSARHIRTESDAADIQELVQNLPAEGRRLTQ